MKIAYVTTYNPSDVTNWSGLGTYIAQALQMQGIDLEVVIVQPEPLLPITLARIQNLAAKATGKRHLTHRAPGVLRAYAHQVEAALRSSSVDLVFSPGSISLAYLEIDRPLVFWTDATFAAMLGYYPEYANLTRASVRYGHQAEQAALSRANAAIYASEWAAESAIQSYHADPDRVHVVPFGPNIEWGYSLDEIRNFISSRPNDRCNLLFIGMDWRRKGGDKAVAVAEVLIKAGVRVRLNIVGCQPPHALPPFARVHGFISKQSSEGKDRLRSLLQESHFLLLPSRAEAYGVAAVEAASVAVPTLASQTGGLAEVVSDGVSGYRLPVDASPELYAEKILAHLNPGAYHDLARSAFSEYQTRLNWQIAGSKVAAILGDLV